MIYQLMQEEFGDGWSKSPQIDFSDERPGIPDDGYHWLASDDDLWWAEDPNAVRRREPSLMLE